MLEKELTTAAPISLCLLTGLDYDHVDFTVEKEWIHHISSPNLYRKPDVSSLSDGDFCDQLIQELEAKILDIGENKVAAFIAEPITGSWRSFDGS